MQSVSAVFAAGSVAVAWEITVRGLGSVLSNADATAIATDFDLIWGEYDLADPSVSATVKVWLSDAAPLLSFNHCNAAAKYALSGGAQLAELTRRHCNA